jgi:hypothetical protein
MNIETDFQRRATAFMADGPTELADRVLEAALREVHLTHQRRRWPTRWWTARMTLGAQAAATVVIVVAASLLGLAVLRPTGVGGPGPVPTVVQTREPTPPPTIPPSPAPAPTPRIAGATIATDGLRLSPAVRYVLADFEPPFSFTGSGLKFGVDGRGYAWFEDVTSPTAVVGVVQPRTAFAEGGVSQPVPTDIVSWLQGRGDLVISSTTPLTLGTVGGTLLEGTVRADAVTNSGNAVNVLCPDATGCNFERGGSLGYAPGDHVLILVATVHGLPVVASASAPEAEWPALRADLDRFLRSFVFPA